MTTHIRISGPGVPAFTAEKLLTIFDLPKLSKGDRLQLGGVEQLGPGWCSLTVKDVVIFQQPNRMASATTWQVADCEPGTLVSSHKERYV